MSSSPGNSADMEAELIALRQRVVELEQAQSRAARILDAASNLIYVFDLTQRKTVYFNRELSTILGYTEEVYTELRQREDPTRTLMHPDDQPRFMQHIQRIMAASDGEVLEFEYRMRHKDGSWRWIQSRDTIFERGADQVPTQIVGSVQEITDRKQAQEELVRSQGLLQGIIENTPAVIYVKDAEGRYLLVNEQAAQVIQQPIDTIIGKTDADLLPPEVATRFREQDRQIIETGVAVSNEEVLHTSMGTRAFLSLGFPIMNDQGFVHAVCGIATDITERKKAQEELVRSQRLLQGIIENVPAVIFVKDSEGRYLLANQQTAQALQQPFDAIVGKTDADMLPPEVAARFEEHGRRVIEAGEPVDLEETMYLETGPRTFFSLGFPIVDEQGVIYAMGGIATDITERKQAEDELRVFKALVENSPDAIGTAQLDGTLTYANPAYGRMTEQERSTLATMNFLDHFTGEHRTVTAQAMQETVEQGTWQGVLTFSQRDGSEIPVQTTGFLVYDDQGQPIVMAGIFHDLTNLLQAEAERARLQEQVIEAQRAALRELSTPLMPIAPGVLAMPLVGTIDTTRAIQVMETLLEGVAAQKARVAILDITGVQVVDTQVAGALIQTAQAVKLLGARVVMTGIGPAMAQTLVQLGIDFSELVTYGSLQEGITYALRR